MFDHINNKKQKIVLPFFSWLDRFVLTDHNLRKARDEMYRCEARVSKLSQWHRVPQSANHHAEGVFLVNHIESMLAGLEAICEQQISLLSIEEFAQKKHYRHRFEWLQDVVCEQAATLKAFILLHDIAKYEAISFRAPLDSRGAKEGFAKQGVLKVADLIDRYQKLVQVFQVQHPDMSGRELAIAFYSTYQISVHYHGHAKIATSPAFKQEREAIADMYRLQARDREMLWLLIRHHMDAIHFSEHAPDAAHYAYLKKVAYRAGIDGDDYRDMQTACLLLDGVIGSIGFTQGAVVHTADQIIRFFQLEEIADQERQALFLQRKDQQERALFVSILQQCGLESEAVFSLLDLPFGPKRSHVLACIEKAVKSGDMSALGEYEQTLKPLAMQAHLLYKAKVE